MKFSEVNLFGRILVTQRPVHKTSVNTEIDLKRKKIRDEQKRKMNLLKSLKDVITIAQRKTKKSKR